MVETDTLRIHYKDIPQRIKAYFGDGIQDRYELDIWDFDLRSQTLLHRDAAGYYEFAHRSLAEYFAAQRLLTEIRAQRYEVLKAHAENPWKFQNLFPFVYDLIDKETLLTIRDAWLKTSRHGKRHLMKPLTSPFWFLSLFLIALARKLFLNNKRRDRGVEILRYYARGLLTQDEVRERLKEVWGQSVEKEIAHIVDELIDQIVDRTSTTKSQI